MNHEVTELRIRIRHDDSSITIVSKNEGGYVDLFSTEPITDDYLSRLVMVREIVIVWNTVLKAKKNGESMMECVESND